MSSGTPARAQRKASLMDRLSRTCREARQHLQHVLDNSSMQPPDASRTIHQISDQHPVLDIHQHGSTVLVDKASLPDALFSDIDQLLQEPPSLLIDCMTVLASHGNRGIYSLVNDIEAPAAAQPSASSQRSVLPWADGNSLLLPAALKAAKLAGLPPSAFPDPEQSIKQRLHAHLDLFLQAQQASAAATAAEERLTQGLGASQLRSLISCPAMHLHLNVCGLRPQVALLRQMRDTLIQEHASRQSVEAQLQAKWDQVTELVTHNSHLDGLLARLLHDNIMVVLSLNRRCQEALEVLMMPAAQEACQRAEGLKGVVWSEVKAFTSMPPQALAPSAAFQPAVAGEVNVCLLLALAAIVCCI